MKRGNRSKRLGILFIIIGILLFGALAYLLFGPASKTPTSEESVSSRTGLFGGIQKGKKIAPAGDISLSEPEADSGYIEEEQIPKKTKSKFKKLADFPITDFFIKYGDKDNPSEIIFNEKKNGKFYKADINGFEGIETESYATESIPGIEELEKIEDGKFLARYLVGNAPFTESASLITFDPIDEKSYCRMEFKSGLKKGDLGREVEILQKFLTESDVSEWMKDYSIGTFDDKTEEVLKRWQRLKNLKDSGVADKATIEKFSSICVEKGVEEAKKNNAYYQYTSIDTPLKKKILSADSDEAGRLFTIERNPSNFEYVIGVIDDGIKTRTVFTNPLSEWDIKWIDGKRILMTVKPTYALEGYSFVLNTESGVMNKMLGGVKGLEALPLGDSGILYSGYVSGEYITMLKNTANDTLKKMPFTTLPMKCDFYAPDKKIYCAVPLFIGSEIPDKWYMGLRTFSDGLIEYDIETGRLRELESSIGMDVEKIKYAEGVLFIKNKTTGKLWAYEI